MSNTLALGVDIGGSHITAALVDLNTRKVLQDSVIRKKLDSHKDAEYIIKAWANTIKESAAFFEGSSVNVGIGMPGPFDYEEGISFLKGQDKYDALYGLNVKSMLAEVLGIETQNIRLMNDAVSFLQGEAFGGAGYGFKKIIGLTLGTGLGSSIVTEGVAVDAGLWNAAFKNGTVEDYLSSRWFVQRYMELSGTKLANVKDLVDVSAADSKALQVFEEFGVNLGLLLNSFISAENPEAIILGGNIVNAFELFEDALTNTIDYQYREIPIFKAVLGEEAALIGASSLWYRG